MIVQELEAKFLMAPGADPEHVLRRLQESLAWAGFRVQPTLKCRLADTYLDTAEQQLRQAGWSLRQRQDGADRCVALKEVNRARAAIFAREEVEQALASADDDARRPPPGAVQERLQQLLAPGAEVAPVFAVETNRARYRLSHPEHPGALVELGFDQTRIRADEALDFVEIELELKQGPHDLLADVLAVAEMEPGLLGARLSKYERGLITAGCATPMGRGRMPRGLSRKSSWLDMGVAYLKSQLAQIKVYEPYAWEGLHVEGVHQMRVAVRRTLAGLRTFAQVLPTDEADTLADHLRRVAAALGEVRDMDVHHAHLTVYRSRLQPSPQECLDGYQTYLLRLHDAARRKLLHALTGDTYANLLGDARGLLIAAARAENGSSLRVEDVAAATVATLLKKVNRRGRVIASGHPTAAELHRLRLASKCLRYQIECLQGAYGTALDEVVLALRGLQDRLGAHQDACMARAHLQNYRSGHARGKRERRLIGQLIDYEKQRAKQERQHLAQHWLRFELASAGLLQRL